MGELGNGDLDGNESTTPVDVSGLTSGVVAIAAGSRHMCALTTAGGVKCWGIGTGLGDGVGDEQLTPVDVVGLTSGVAAIAASFYNTCAVTTVGGVKCWGEGIAVGDGTGIQRLTPVDVSGLTSGVAAITGGNSDGGHMCAMTTRGGLKCWGDDSYGQLGDGTTSLPRLIPVNVIGFPDGVQALAAAVAAGASHTCALTIGGSVKCWGGNVEGQLGDGTTTQRLTPVNVSGLTSPVTTLAAGYQHTCALTLGGGVKCWGSNSFNQLGDNTTTRRSTPVNVNELTNGVAAIAAGPGSLFTCALTTGGGVKCWGHNALGELGHGTQVQQPTPVNVSGLTSGVAALAVGTGHACALTIGGGVKCWGLNVSGQLGDGTTTNRVTPVDVSGLTSGVAAVAAGHGHTCAVTIGGAVTCWGSNSSGELGNARLYVQSSLPTNTVGFASEFASASVGPGGTATTDTEMDGATPTDLIETSVTSPDAGTVTISEGPIATAPSGYRLLGEQAQISAAPATVGAPLVLAFRLDASSIPAGQDETTIAVFRNGALVPPCSGAPSAIPDPCVSVRTRLGDDVAITVLTSAASDWTLGVEICPAMPVTGCRVPASTKGLLKISENADPAKNKLEWKWSKGAATTKAEFGDPTSTEDYTLCIYDAGALVSSTRIEAGGVCAGKNCWKENSKGYQFKDEELTPDGARQLQLKEGIAGVAQIQLKGRGANLELPPVLTSLTGPIEVQLTQARGAACWGATFSAPFTKQDAVNLLGKSD